MRDIIDQHGGLASTAELHAAGFGRLSIQFALDRGEVIRIRQGWYARPGLDPDILSAARVGGRATCRTALRSIGVWVHPGRGDLHVAVPPHACRLRAPHDSRRRLSPSDPVRVHWDDRRGSSRLRVDVVQAFRDLALCVSDEALVASADSLLRIRPDFRRVSSSRPDALGIGLREVLARADGVCESGTETYFWLRMRPRLSRIRRQVRIRSVGRVDFLIGRRLVVEIDGAAYHTDPAAFERDRRRDALLSRLGYRVLRFSYHQVMSEWATVEAAVLAAIARSDHL